MEEYPPELIQALKREFGKEVEELNNLRDSLCLMFSKDKRKNMTKYEKLSKSYQERRDAFITEWKRKKAEYEELSRKIRERINKVGVYNVGNMRQEEFDEAFGDIFNHT